MKFRHQYFPSLRPPFLFCSRNIRARDHYTLGKKLFSASFRVYVCVCIVLCGFQQMRFCAEKYRLKSPLNSTRRAIICPGFLSVGPPTYQHTWRDLFTAASALLPAGIYLRGTFCEKIRHSRVHANLPEINKPFPACAQSYGYSILFLLLDNGPRRN
jgi:hypothetical protein